MQFANLFPKNRSTVITFYSGAFSSSAVLFVLLKYAYDAGVSFNTTCCSMVIAALLMLPVTFFLLPHDRVHEPEPAPDSAEIMSKKKYAKGNLALVSSTMITLEKFKALESPIAGRKGIVNAVMDVEDEIALDDCESTASSEEVIIRKRGQQQAEVNRDTEIRSATPFTGKIVILPLSSLKMSSAGVNKATCDALRGSNCKVDHAGCCKARQEASSNSHNNNSSQNCDDRPPSCSPSSSGSCRSSTDSEEMIPLSQSLFSIPFSLHQWWYSWLITYMIMYVGTMNLWLDRVTSDRQVICYLFPHYSSCRCLSTYHHRNLSLSIFGKKQEREKMANPHLISCLLTLRCFFANTSCICDLGRSFPGISVINETHNVDSIFPLLPPASHARTTGR